MIATVICFSVLSHLQLSAASQEPVAKVEFTSTPTLLAAGEPFSVTVRYAAPPARKHRLNVELKDAAGRVIGVARTEISGRGEYRASLTAPRKVQRVTLAAWVGTDWQAAISSIRRSQPSNPTPIPDEHLFSWNNLRRLGVIPM